MGRVSRKIINRDLQSELEEQLSFIVSSLSNKEEIEKFLTEFLTREEKVMLGKRLLLYMMLYKDFPTSKIYSSLSMSRETIRWYKQVFEGKSQVFKKVIEKLIKRERNRMLWAKIEKILEPMSLAMQAKSNMKARAKLASGDFWNRE